MTKIRGLAFLLSILLTVPLNAQVTIGSNTVPRSGMLLDLTEGTQTTKGLGLPRVTLKTLSAATDDLRETIFGADTNTGESWRLMDHAGTLVYNIANNSVSSLASGIYMWDGEKWQVIQSFVPAPPAQGKANSYIMQPNSWLSIPVEHGFDVWNAYSAASGIDKQQGKVLDLSSVNNLTGKLSASIRWQEDRDNGKEVLGNVYIDSPNALSAANLIVQTSAKYSNALIAVHLGTTGTTSDPVLWQWHIWVPEGEPQALPAVVAGANASWTFMDRYLGAINNTPVTYNSNNPTTRDAHGLHYQWGRPTPFPKFKLSLNTDAVESEQANFTKAIQGSNFIKTTAELRYWYASSSDVKWANRWGDGSTDNDTGSKSLLDPCPSGWRVPANKSNITPWQAFPDYASHSTNNQGLFIESAGYGYYSYAGYRSADNGSLHGRGTTTYMWSATHCKEGGENIRGELTYFTTAVMDYRACTYISTGSPIRCIRE